MAWQSSINTQRESPTTHSQSIFLSSQGFQNLAFCDKGRNDTSKRTSYSQDWTKAACSDPVFVQTQLDIGHAMYLQPALKYAAIVNVTTNLGKAIFYDTIINHGWQFTKPLINLPRIIQLTGPRGPSESEQAYLNRFLVTRRQLMCCYPDTVWPPAADRVSDLQTLVSNWSTNVNLTNPGKLVVYGVTIKGAEDMSYDTAECSKKPRMDFAFFPAFAHPRHLSQSSND